MPDIRDFMRIVESGIGHNGGPPLDDPEYDPQNVYDFDKITNAQQVFLRDLWSSFIKDTKENPEILNVNDLNKNKKYPDDQFSNCVHHVIVSEHVPTGPTKREFSDRYTSEPRWYPDVLDIIPGNAFRKWCKNNTTKINSLGWELSRESIGSIYFERLTTDRAEIPRYLYHTTLRSQLETILQNGLQPRYNPSWGHKYSPRVYFTTNFVANNKVFAKFCEYDVVRHQKRDYVVLKIDTRKVKRNTFHYDTQFAGRGNAVYTVDAIPANAIHVDESAQARAEQYTKKFLKPYATDPDYADYFLSK